MSNKAGSVTNKSEVVVNFKDTRDHFKCIWAEEMCKNDIGLWLLKIINLFILIQVKYVNEKNPNIERSIKWKMSSPFPLFYLFSGNYF